MSPIQFVQVSLANNEKKKEKKSPNIFPYKFRFYI